MLCKYILLNPCLWAYEDEHSNHAATSTNNNVFQKSQRGHYLNSDETTKENTSPARFVCFGPPSRQRTFGSRQPVEHLDFTLIQNGVWQRSFFLVIWPTFGVILEGPPCFWRWSFWIWGKSLYTTGWRLRKPQLGCYSAIWLDKNWTSNSPIL